MGFFNNGGSDLIGSAINTVGNVVGVSLANSSNERNTDKVNAANERINESQLAYARQQWQNELAETKRQRAENRSWTLQDKADERSYNSPAAIAQRYRQAGINPYLAMMNGSSGSVGSVGSSNASPSVPSGHQPQAIPAQQGAPANVVNFDTIGYGISNAMKSWFASQQEDREAHALGFDMMYKMQQQKMDFMKMIKDSDREDKRLNHEMNMALKRFSLEMDKYWQSLDMQSFQKEMQSIQANNDTARVNMEQLLSQANIRLSKSQVAHFTQLVTASVEDQLRADKRLRLDERRQDDQELMNDFLRTIQSQQFIHKVEQDLFDNQMIIKEFNLENDKASWSKIKDVIGSAVTIGATVAGGYFFGPMGAAAGLGIGSISGTTSGNGRYSYRRR